MSRTKEEILNGMPLPEFLLRCRTSFKFFCEECLGVKTYGGIHDFQIKWFNLANKYKQLVLEAPAGFSKSDVMGAMYPIWLMLTQKNLKILLVNKTMEQGKANLLSRIKNYIADNEILTEIFTPDDYKATWNQSEIKTKNGHWVKNVPYNVNIRGYRAHYIFLDEVDSYDDVNIFFEHVTSRLYPGGTMILMSTPVGPTRLIGLLKEKQKAGLLNGQYHFERTTALIDKDGKPATIENQEDILKFESIWPEMWSKETLFERWGVQGKSNWMRNYMCECMGEIDDALFPIKNIINSYDYNRGFDDNVDNEALYFISADFAISDGPRADFDAYLVVEKKEDQYIIKNMEIHKGWQRPEKIKRLKELYNHFNKFGAAYVVVDSSNMGTMVMNDLRADGIPVAEQVFHTSARKKIIINLGVVFSGKAIVIPRSPDANDECVKLSQLLQEQLTGFRRRKSDKTGDELIESRAAHDDLAIALAMAIAEAVGHSQMDVLPVSG